MLWSQEVEAGHESSKGPTEPSPTGSGLHLGNDRENTGSTSVIRWERASSTVQSSASVGLDEAGPGF